MSHNPLTYYQFDGNYLDSSVNANNGTPSGTTAFGASAPVGGQSLSLTASGYVNGSDLILPSGSSNRSIIAWVKTNQAVGTSYPTFVFYGNTGSYNSIFFMRPSDTDPNFNSSVSGELGVSHFGDGLAGTTALGDNNWHFIAVTMEDQGSNTAINRLYVDGVLQSSATQDATTTLNGASGLYIGATSLGPAYNYFGLISHVAIFGSTLSDAQVLSLYETVPVPEPATLLSLMLGLVCLSQSARRRRARQ